MENTLKIRIFTIHTSHIYMVVKTTHNVYMCNFHQGQKKRAYISQTNTGLKTILNKHAPGRYIE